MTKCNKTIPTPVQPLCIVIEFSENQDNEGLKNFWTTNEEGDVFLWGFSREFGLRYDPPIMVVDSPLSLGQSWDVVSDVYDFSSGNFVGTFEFTLEVMEEGIYQVGAGSLSWIERCC